ncbi:MBOAT, membrane-bound O-acyltransferase family-domain-containing protein [Kockovaella imperatae]|uniref:MBOAT, membrane-bound O-acyltransferase family-domain-containing protein n=1 Tax=Kockovaella imperatae TaxID=4999 RepID=A0A1Y1UMQ4_9TREE|nr:MBOAT, membrane-bound O-acyltransferase family-domain-containing protein [Kockovaella imperatae]ORX39272.1 MBOAT, membrane-bound O-acyltransferase family-domain-containing protein [Kockovaella imperatae]
MPTHTGPGTSKVQQEDRRSITDLTISVSFSKPSVSAQASRWRSTEFRFYAVAFALVVPMMVYIPMRYSSQTNLNYMLYAWRLSPGWIFGWKVDNSDHQYHTFRSGLPSLVLLAALHLASSSLARRFSSTSETKIRIGAGLSIGILFILHGLSTIKILIILAGNYAAAKWTKPETLDKFWPGMVVVGNMGILFLNERFEGYPLARIHPALTWLDQVSGVLPRWHINFNITMLRLVSFSLDYHWRRQANTTTTPPMDYRSRVTSLLEDDAYSPAGYLAYCLYPPLYIAGPIMTFNDFIWQQRQPVTITPREKLSYAIRFASCLLTMELILHTMYVVAIKDSSAWNGAGPAQLCMIGFWNLVVVWLKLLIPWRFFRLWALLDGIDPPENMIRCVANNYSTLGFWRSWHRSYNLWIVRYIYVPLGGSRNVIPSTLLVFTFVALWHDLSFKLLAWGWLVSLFILPELLGRRLVSSKQYGDRWWYRHVAALGGVCNILMMMSANLVGFVLGLEGLRHLLTELATPAGIIFTIFASCCLFIAVQVMFEYREEELRKGIDRKC